jgi:transcriptional regulator with XRE-family HTH domain
MSKRNRGATLLRQWCKANNISQREAGKRMGVSGASVADWKLGKKKPGADNALKIAALTDGAVPIEAWQ